MEESVSSERIYTGRTLNLRIDTVRLPDGTIAEREVVEHAAVVHIVPVDGEGHLLLIRQYRVPAGKELLELPAGGILPGETPVDAAQRELREETGYRAGSLEPLSSFYSTPGYCDEFNHLFVATGLVYDPLEPDADENISMFPVSPEEARRLVKANEIGDAKSAAGLLLYLMFREKD